MVKKGILTMILLSLVLFSGCTPGPGTTQPQVSPGPGTSQPQDSPGAATVTKTCRIVDGAEDGGLLLAELNGGADEVFILNATGVPVIHSSSAADWSVLRDGMVIDIEHDGMILETYPASFSSVTAIYTTDEPVDDRCGLYLQMLEDLWVVDGGLNEGISQLGVDVSELSDLEKAEKSALAYSFGMAHGIMPIMGTMDELIEWGYFTIDPYWADAEEKSKAMYHWEDGCLFSITGEAEGFDAQKWCSGLGAYFFGACTGKQAKDGTWSYKIGNEAIA